MFDRIDETRDYLIGFSSFIVWIYSVFIVATLFRGRMMIRVAISGLILVGWVGWHLFRSIG